MTPTLNRPARLPARTGPTTPSDPCGRGPSRTLSIAELVTLTVAELARLCHDESVRYHQREPYDERPARELFRRAVVAGDDAAWAAIYAQYAGTVRHWLDLRDEEDDAITAVFERFWHAVDAAKFALFTSLGAILAYLRACASSVRVDRARAARASGVLQSLDEEAHALPARQDVEETVVEHTTTVTLWTAVRDTLSDEREREVVYLSYVAGLSPRQIYARGGTRFADVAEVYRVKRAVLGRLRRSSRLRMLLVSS